MVSGNTLTSLKNKKPVDMIRILLSLYSLGEINLLISKLSCFFSFNIRLFLKNTAAASLALPSERAPGLERMCGRSASIWTQWPLYDSKGGQEGGAGEQCAAGFQDSLFEVHQF